jgi:hypothetical protein
VKIVRKDRTDLPHVGDVWESRYGTGSYLLLYVLEAEVGTRLTRCTLLGVEKPCGEERVGGVVEWALMDSYYRRVE